jgi:hypothetical protein
MYTLRYDGDITRSPEFKLRGKATLTIINRKGYECADEPGSWMSEEDAIQSLLDDEDVNGDESLARNKIWSSDLFLRKDRQETTVELFPGSDFCYGYREGTDEGFSSYGIQVEWQDDHWEVEVTNGGADCDGNYSRNDDYRVNPDGSEFDEKTEIYDQNAQEAGF